MTESVTLNQAVFTHGINNLISEMKVAIDLAAKSFSDRFLVGDI
jgi:hypothetical protein